jgi:hypothetical protein
MTCFQQDILTKEKRKTSGSQCLNVSHRVKAIITGRSVDQPRSATATALLDARGLPNDVCEILLKYVRREV